VAPSASIGTSCGRVRGVIWQPSAIIDLLADGIDGVEEYEDELSEVVFVSGVSVNPVSEVFFVPDVSVNALCDAMNGLADSVSPPRKTVHGVAASVNDP
jgi:hypothetical protein